MTNRIPLTYEQAAALKPGDRFLDRATGLVRVVVEKVGLSCFREDEWVWSVDERDYVGPTQEPSSIYRFDEMAAYEGFWVDNAISMTGAVGPIKLNEVFSVYKDQKRLLTLKADGTIEADLSDIDEGAKIFVESLSKYWLQTTGKSVADL